MMKREPEDHLSVEIFLRVGAIAEDVAAPNGVEDHDSFRDACYSGDIISAYPAVGSFPFEHLDTDKMIAHIIDCASALSRIHRARNKQLMESRITEGRNNDSANDQQKLVHGAKRKAFSFALRTALSVFMGDGDDSHESPPATKELLRAFPDNSKLTDGRTWLPLHWAAVGVEEVGLETMKLLYSEKPHILSKTHSEGSNHTEGYTPLHLLCMTEKPNLSALKHFAIADPGAFNISAERSDEVCFEDRLFQDGYYPLHAAAWYCNSTEAIQLLLQVNNSHICERAGLYSHCYPLDILVSTYNRNRDEFPAMFECLLQVSYIDATIIGHTMRALIGVLHHSEAESDWKYLLSLLERLVEQYPDVVRDYRNVYDGLGPTDADTLLQTAIDRKFDVDEVCVKVLKLLVDAAPELLTIGGDAGYLPVQTVAYQGDVAAFKFLVELSPDMRNFSDGDNILHYAFRANKIRLDIIRYLFDRYPDMLQVRTSNGFTSLILILLNIRCSPDTKWDAVDALLKFSPEIVKLPCICPPTMPPSPFQNFHLRLPLHVIMMMIKKKDLVAGSRLLHYIRLFLQLYPEAVSAKDGEGLTPYDYVKHRDVPLVHRMLLRIDPDQDRDTFRKLNWEARRMAMFLGFRAVSAMPETTIFAMLRFESRDLYQRMVSFL